MPLGKSCFLAAFLPPLLLAASFSLAGQAFAGAGSGDGLCPEPAGSAGAELGGDGSGESGDSSGDSRASSPSATGLASSSGGCAGSVFSFASDSGPLGAGSPEYSPGAFGGPARPLALGDAGGLQNGEAVPITAETGDIIRTGAATGIDAVISGGGTWEGDLTTDGVHMDTVTIEAGMSATGDWDLGDGANSIKRAAAGTGDATISGTVTLGAGNDTIGGATASAPESMLAITGGISLGAGTNIMRVSSAGAPGLEGDAITGGLDPDTVEVAGAITGSVDLGDGLNSLSARSLSGSYTGLSGADTVTVRGDSGGDSGAAWSFGGGNDALALESRATVSAAVDMGAGANTVSGLGAFAGGLRFGGGDDTIGVFGAGKRASGSGNRLSLGAVDMGAGLNRLAASSATSITGGAQRDIVILQPRESFTLGTLSLGGQSNRVVISGDLGSPAGKTATLALSGTTSSDSIFLCNADVDLGDANNNHTCLSAPGSGEGRAFSAALDASGAGGRGAGTVDIQNLPSSFRSELTVKGEVHLGAASELEHFLLKADGSAGDSLVFKAAAEIKAPSPAAAPSLTLAGALFQLDLDPLASGGSGLADKLVFDVDPASGAGLTKTPAVEIVAGEGAAAPSTVVTIAQVKSGLSNVTGLSLWNALPGDPSKISLNGQVWTLASDTTTRSGYTTYTLNSEALILPAFDLRRVTIATSGSDSFSGAGTPAPLSVELAGSGAWSGSFTARTGDFGDRIILGGAVSGSGPWSLGAGDNLIRFDAGASGSYSGAVTMGAGDDVIGGASSASGASFTGGVTLGDGSNFMSARAVSASSGAAVTGGSGPDAVEIASSFSGGVTLGLGADSLAIGDPGSAGVSSSGEVDLGGVAEPANPHLAPTPPGDSLTLHGGPTLSGAVIAGAGVTTIAGSGTLTAGIRGTTGTGSVAVREVIVVRPAGDLDLGGVDLIASPPAAAATNTEPAAPARIDSLIIEGAPGSVNADASKDRLVSLAAGGASNQGHSFLHLCSQGAGPLDVTVATLDAVTAACATSGLEGDSTFNVSLDATGVGNTFEGVLIESRSGSAQQSVLSIKGSVALRSLSPGQSDPSGRSLAAGNYGDLRLDNLRLAGNAATGDSLAIHGGRSLAGDSAVAGNARSVFIKDPLLEGAAAGTGGTLFELDVKTDGAVAHDSLHFKASARLLHNSAIRPVLKLMPTNTNTTAPASGSKLNLMTTEAGSAVTGFRILGGQGQAVELNGNWWAAGKSTDAATGVTTHFLEPVAVSSIAAGSADEAAGTGFKVARIASGATWTGNYAGNAAGDIIIMDSGSSASGSTWTLNTGPTTIMGSGTISATLTFGNQDDTIGNFAPGAAASSSMLTIQSALSLGGGNNSVKMPTATLSVTAGDGDDRVALTAASGSAAINLGGGSNSLALEAASASSWAGAYGSSCTFDGSSYTCAGGGSGADVVTIGANVTAAAGADIHLGGGADTLVVAGTSSAPVSLGVGNDTIRLEGAATQGGAITGGAVAGTTNLGAYDASGKIIAGQGSITGLMYGNAGKDLVIVRASGPISITNMNLLSSGAQVPNVVAIEGGEGDPAGMGVTVALDKGSATGSAFDWVALCGSGLAGADNPSVQTATVSSTATAVSAPACAGGGSGAFNATLDASGAGGNRVENVIIGTEGGAARQSLLTVKGSVAVRAVKGLTKAAGASPVDQMAGLESLRLAADGNTGDSLTIHGFKSFDDDTAHSTSGSVMIRDPALHGPREGEGGTLFELDVNLSGTVASDTLVFGESARLAPGSGATPVIKLMPVSASQAAPAGTPRLNLVAVHEDSQIAGIRILGGYEYVSQAIEVNGQWWRLAEPILSGGVYTYSIEHAASQSISQAESQERSSDLPPQASLRILEMGQSPPRAGENIDININSGAGGEIITVKSGVTIRSGSWDLRQGGAVLKGSGAIAQGVEIQFKPDSGVAVGSFRKGAQASDNGLAIMAPLALGSGNNMIRARTVSHVTSGAGDDTIELSGASGGGNMSLGDGSNSLSLMAPAPSGNSGPSEWAGNYGSCAVAGGETVCAGGGSGDDSVTIGENVSMSGAIHLGGGDNTLTAMGAIEASVQGGEGRDMVILGAAKGATLSRLSLGGGVNTVYVQGTSPGAGTDPISMSPVILPLAGKRASDPGQDSIYLCGEGLGADGGCAEDAALGNYAYKVTLDASGGESAWENIQVWNQPSSERSELTVKGIVSLKFARLENMLLRADGAAGDTLVFDGPVAILPDVPEIEKTPGALFQVDVDPEAGKADLVVFGAQSRALEGYRGMAGSPDFRVMGAGHGLAAEGAAVTIARLGARAPVKGIRVQNARLAALRDSSNQLVSEAVVTINGQDWRLGERTAGGMIEYTLTARAVQYATPSIGASGNDHTASATQPTRATVGAPGGGGTWAGDYVGSGNLIDEITIDAGMTATGAGGGSGSWDLKGGHNAIKRAAAGTAPATVTATIMMEGGNDRIGGGSLSDPESGLILRDVDLGGGANELRALSARSVTGGDGHDTVELGDLSRLAPGFTSQDMPVINLKGGGNALSVSADSAAEWGAGYGDCALSSGALSCSAGGSGIDRVAIGENVTATGPFHLGAGADSLSVAGTVSGQVDLGDGDDVIAISGAVSGQLNLGGGSDSITLGGQGSGGAVSGPGLGLGAYGPRGKTISGSGSVSAPVAGGPGRDTLLIKPTGDLSFSGINLMGSDALNPNVIAIEGMALAAGSEAGLVTLPLSGGLGLEDSPADYVALCAYGLRADGASAALDSPAAAPVCAGPPQSAPAAGLRAFRATLDAQAGNSFEGAVIDTRQPGSAPQSALTIRGDVLVRAFGAVAVSGPGLTPGGGPAVSEVRLDNFMLAGDGNPGDTLSIHGAKNLADDGGTSAPSLMMRDPASLPGQAGKYSGTVFTLDVKTDGAVDADSLEFGPSVRLLAGSSSAPSVILAPVESPDPPAPGSQITLVRASLESGISGVRIISALPRSGAVSLNGRWWDLKAPDVSGGVARHYLEPVETVVVSGGEDDLSAPASGLSLVSITGHWSGSYAGGPLEDHIRVQAGAIASGDLGDPSDPRYPGDPRDLGKGAWDLGGGDDSLVGSGVIADTAVIRMGEGDDMVGSFAPGAPPGDSGLVIAASLDLGDGRNMVRARRAAGIDGGAGPDTVEILGLGDIGPLHDANGNPVRLPDGNINLGGGDNSLTLASQSPADWGGGYGDCGLSGGALSCSGGGSGRDDVTIGGGVTVTSPIHLGGGDNTLTALGGMRGELRAGGGDDTVVMHAGPASELSAIDLGGGENTLVVFGRAGGAEGLISLSLSGGPAGGGQDSIALRSCAAGGEDATEPGGRACAAGPGAGGGAYKVALDGAAGNAWERIEIDNSPSSAQSVIEISGAVTLRMGRMENAMLAANQRAGDTMTFDGPVAFKRFGSGGTLVQLDFDPGSADAASPVPPSSDRLVLTAGAVPIEAGLPTVIDIDIRSLPGSARDGESVDIASISSASGVTGISIRGSYMAGCDGGDPPVCGETGIYLNNQKWVLASSEAQGSLTFTLTSSPFTVDNVDLAASSPDFTSTIPTVATVSGSWAGSYSSGLAAYPDTIVIAAGTTGGALAKTWSLGPGGDAIRRAGSGAGAGVVASEVFMGAGNDVIGGAAGSLESLLDFRAAVSLGEGDDTMRAMAAADITGGDTGADTVEISGEVSGDVDLGGGANVLRASVLDGRYIGGAGPDTIEITDRASGNLDLGGGAGSNTLSIRVLESEVGNGTDTGVDMVTLALGGNGQAVARLGDGENHMALEGGEWEGQYIGGAGPDTLRGGGRLGGTAVLGGGDDRVGIDPGGADGRLDTAGDNPSPGDLLASNSLVITGRLDLGPGFNRVWAESLAEASSGIFGGTGPDSITLSGSAHAAIDLGGDAQAPGAPGGDNFLSVGGNLEAEVRNGTDRGADRVSIGGGAGNVNLGGGRNFLEVSGNWGGSYGGGSGPDTVRGFCPAAGGCAPALSGPVSLGAGADTVGADPASPGGLSPAGVEAANSLSIAGGLDLGAGADIVFARALAHGGSIMAGDGADRIAISGPAGGDGPGNPGFIDLGGGAFDNSLRVGGELSIEVRSAATGTDAVWIGGGSGNVTLGGGTNLLTISGGEWSGAYVDGSGDDVITVEAGAAISSDISLAGSGRDVIKGSGVISGRVTLNAGDTLGGLPGAAFDNGLYLDGGLRMLGGGAARAAGASSIAAGVESVSVYLKPTTKSFTLLDLDLGGGVYENRLWIIGNPGRVQDSQSDKSRKASVSLSGASGEKDFMYICNEGAREAAGGREPGCSDEGAGSHSFNVLLNATSTAEEIRDRLVGDGGILDSQANTVTLPDGTVVDLGGDLSAHYLSAWETILIGNKPSDTQSVLGVRGEVTLSSPEFNNIRVEDRDPGAAPGDIIRVAGDYVLQDPILSGAGAGSSGTVFVLDVGLVCESGQACQEEDLEDPNWRLSADQLLFDEDSSPAGSGRKVAVELKSAGLVAERLPVKILEFPAAAGISAEFLGALSSGGRVIELGGSEWEISERKSQGLTAFYLGPNMSVMSATAGDGDVDLGGGSNQLTIHGEWAGDYTGLSGVDTLILERGASSTGTLDLGGGHNVITGAGPASVSGIVMGDGNDTIGAEDANMLQLGGVTVLGDGNNTVHAASAGSIAAGIGEDTIALGGDAGSAAGGSFVVLDDRDGGDTEPSGSNSLTVGGRLFAKVTSNAAGSAEDMVRIAGGTGDIDLGGGSNSLAVSYPGSPAGPGADPADGEWSGDYRGLGGRDTVEAARGTRLSGALGLGGGDDVLKGSGHAARALMGAGDDRIGEPAAPGALVDFGLEGNGLALGELDLGGGSNMVVAARVSERICAGALKGQDICGERDAADSANYTNRVYLRPDSSFTLRLESAATVDNSLWIAGSAGDPSSRTVTISPASWNSWDSVTICSESLRAGGGCEDNGDWGGHAFSAILGAPGLSKEISLASEQSSERSRLQVSGDITLPSPRLHNLLIAGDGAGGDSVAVTGPFEMTAPNGSADGSSGTVFTLDVAPRGGGGECGEGSDCLIFRSTAVSSPLGARQAFIGLRPVPGGGGAPDDGHRIEIARIFDGSNIDGVVMMTDPEWGLSEVEGVVGQYEMGGHLWDLHEGTESNFTSYQLHFRGDFAMIGDADRSRDVDLGGGVNVAKVNTAWAGSYSGGSGGDTLELFAGASMSRLQHLGEGSNVVISGASPGETAVSGVPRVEGGLSFGSGDDTIGGSPGAVSPAERERSRLDLGGEIRLGGGANAVSARALLAGGSIIGGPGPDVVSMSGEVLGLIDLGAGFAPGSAFIGGALRGSVRSSSAGAGADRDEVEIVALEESQGSAGTVSLGGGDNRLTVSAGSGASPALWSGSYVDGPGGDEIVVGAGAEIASGLSLRLGANAVMGAGTLSGAVVFGAGDDHVGIDPAGPDGDIGELDDNPSPARLLEANSLSLDGRLDLGGGDNAVWAASAVSLSAGGGDDSVYLAPFSGFAMSSLDLGGGANTLWISGERVSSGEARVEVPLSGGDSGARNSLYVCGHGMAAGGGCSLSGGANSFFTAVLDARSGNSWDMVHASGGAQVIVKGVVTLSSAPNPADSENPFPALRGVSVQHDEVAGDVIVVRGVYDITQASFALDVNVDSGKSDTVRFAGAVPSSGSARDAAVTLAPLIPDIPEGDGAEMTIVTAECPLVDGARVCSIDNVTINGSSLRPDDLVRLGNDDWKVRIDGEATRSWTLRRESSMDVRSSGSDPVDLGGGQNTLEVKGPWAGKYTGRGGPDTIKFDESATSGRLELGEGVNTVEAAGSASIGLSVKNSNPREIDPRSIIMGAGDDFIRGARLRIEGEVELGGGRNEVNVASSGAITGGEGEDLIIVAGSIAGREVAMDGGATAIVAVDLKGGRKNTLTVGGKVGGDILSAAEGEGDDRDDFRVADVSGSVDLGGGENHLEVSGGIDGGYSGGDGIDRIVIREGGVVSGTIDVGKGDNVITGNSSRQSITLAAGSGTVDLVDGYNTARLRGVWDGEIKGGPGRDSVMLGAGAPTSMDLGEGENTVFIEGADFSGGGPLALPARTMLSLSGASGGSDALLVCGGAAEELPGAALAGQCGTSGINRPFNAELDARNGNGWEEISVVNKRGQVQSELHVRGDLELRNPDFGSARVSLADGAAGGVLTIRGGENKGDGSLIRSEYGILAPERLDTTLFHGTVFELDFDPSGGKSDKVEFKGVQAMAGSGNYVKTAAVALKVAPGGRVDVGNRLDIVSWDAGSDIEGVTVEGVDAQGRIVLNNQVWRFAVDRPEAGGGSAFLVAAELALRPKAVEQHVFALAGGAAGSLRTTVSAQLRNPGTLDDGVDSWVELRSGSETREVATDKTQKHDHEFQFINTGVEVLPGLGGGGDSVHTLLVQYGTADSGAGLESSILGLGYSMEFREPDGQYLNLTGTRSRIVVENSRAGAVREFESVGTSAVIEAGWHVQRSERLSLLPVARITYLNFDASSVSGGVNGFVKLSGDFGVTANLAQFGGLGDHVGNLYGGAAVVRDFVASFKDEEQTEDSVQEETWTRLHGGWSRGFGESGSLFLELSLSASAGGDVSADRQSFTAGYDLEW